MKLLIKPWKNREDGRILLLDGHKVVFSCHFRDMNQRLSLVSQFSELIKKRG